MSSETIGRRREVKGNEKATMRVRNEERRRVRKTDALMVKWKSEKSEVSW